MKNGVKIKHYNTMKKILILLITFWGSDVQKSHGQKACGSKFVPEQVKLSDFQRYQRFLRLEEHVNNFQKSSLSIVNKSRISNPNSIIIIPVVVHVIHNVGEAIGVGRNISQAQIESQIDVLNEDFRRLNADRFNTPAAFQLVADDPNFEFRLACIDPNGNSTNGITRTASTVTTFTPNNEIKFNSTGGHDA